MSAHMRSGQSAALEADTAASSPAMVQVDSEKNERSMRFGDADIQSAMDLRDPDRLVLDYTRLMMGFVLFVPRPSNILMIGLGGGSLPKYCYRHLPGADITVVEISPEVTAMRDLFLVPPDQSTFRVVEADGADYVAEADDERFDVIVVDGFHAEAMPPSLGSQDFYAHCARLLRTGGVMVCNLHELDLHLGIYLSRIGSAFDGAVVSVPTRECGNSVVFARKGMSVRAGLPRHLQRPEGMPDHAWSGIEADMHDVLRRARTAGQVD